MTSRIQKKLTASWQAAKHTLEAEPRGPVIRPLLWIGLPLALTALFTWFVRATDFDYQAQKAIYTAGGDSWSFGDRSLWWFLYEFGTIPAAVLCALAVVVFVIGVFRQNWRKFRYLCIYIVLLGVTGPGIITNLLLKEYWGRPRPREVEGLGGTYPFEQVLHIDLSSSGKSFPCGHATMGYFFIGGFFLLRRYHRPWAEAFLYFGLILGFFMGVARMCQGGHFFSDVIWSAAVMYFVAMALYYALRLHRGILREPPRMNLGLKIAIPLGGIALVIGILLATPYRNYRNFSLTTDHALQNDLDILLTLKAGRIHILPGTDFRVKGEAWGHGVPTSRVAATMAEYLRGESSGVHYMERISGRFTEVTQDITVTIPWDRTDRLHIQADHCQVDILLPKLSERRQIVIEGRDNSVEFVTRPENFSWNDDSDRARFGDANDPVQGNSVVIDVLDEYQGTLLVPDP